MITRRSLFAGVGAVLAAPAIVRASSLMPVKVQPPRSPRHGFAYVKLFSGEGRHGNGATVGFDPDTGCERYPAGERLFIGDIVCIRDVVHGYSSGSAYAFDPMSRDVFHPIAGVVMGVGPGLS